MRLGPFAAALAERGYIPPAELKQRFLRIADHEFPSFRDPPHSTDRG